MSHSIEVTQSVPKNDSPSQVSEVTLDILCTPLLRVATQRVLRDTDYANLGNVGEMQSRIYQRPPILNAECKVQQFAHTE